MRDPRRLTEFALQSAARGHQIRAGGNGKQPDPSPVIVEADLHITFPVSSELQGREWLVELEGALLRRGASVTVDGPRVVPAATPRPRGVQ